MGLDCTAYSNVAVLPPDPDREVDWGTTVDVYAYKGFHQSTRGLVDHDVVTSTTWGDLIAKRDYDVTGGESFGWHAGSYSGYGRWRDSLADVAGWEIDRDDPLASKDQPFFELVWFADNEGAIGHEAAADLLKDFKAHRDAYVAAHSGDGTWFVTAYDEWIRALELAAQHGLIHFH